MREMLGALLSECPGAGTLSECSIGDRDPGRPRAAHVVRGHRRRGHAAHRRAHDRGNDQRVAAFDARDSAGLLADAALTHRQRSRRIRQENRLEYPSWIRKFDSNVKHLRPCETCELAYPVAVQPLFQQEGEVK